MPSDLESPPMLSAIGAFVEPRDIAGGAEALRGFGYDDGEAACLRRALDYARSFLGRSHPHLGRAGPVCPFIGGAIRGNFLRFAASRLDEGRLGELPDLAEGLFQSFDRQMANLEDDTARVFASMIVIFPRLGTDAGFAAVEETQAVAKSAFVERGYMIGEFYPGNRTSGLHNPEFHPLDAPFASLAVRRMTTSDAPFMLGDASYRSAFVRHFGSEGTTSLETAATRYGRDGVMRDGRSAVDREDHGRSQGAASAEG